MADIVQTSDSIPNTACPKASFLQLPSELRNTIYELLLLRYEPIDHWFAHSLGLTAGLLRVCKVIHHEAISLLYGGNQFDFTESNPQNLALFFERIGSRNAGHIHHILVKFPHVFSLRPGNVTLSEGSISELRTFQSNCPHLSTLTTCLHSMSAMAFRLDNLDDVSVAIEALNLIDIHFRAIPSMPNIILHAFEDRPRYQLRQTMEGLNWQLRTISDRDYMSLDSDDDYDTSDGYGDDWEECEFEIGSDF